jgi:hypothetical protein
MSTLRPGKRHSDSRSRSRVSDKSAATHNSKQLVLLPNHKKVPSVSSVDSYTVRDFQPARSSASKTNAEARDFPFTHRRDTFSQDDSAAPRTTRGGSPNPASSLKSDRTARSHRARGVRTDVRSSTSAPSGDNFTWARERSWKQSRVTTYGPAGNAVVKDDRSYYDREFVNGRQVKHHRASDSLHRIPEGELPPSDYELAPFDPCSGGGVSHIPSGNSVPGLSHEIPRLDSYSGKPKQDPKRVVTIRYGIGSIPRQSSVPGSVKADSRKQVKWPEVKASPADVLSERGHSQQTQRMASASSRRATSTTTRGAASGSYIHGGRDHGKLSAPKPTLSASSYISRPAGGDILREVGTVPPEARTVYDSIPDDASVASTLRDHLLTPDDASDFNPVPRWRRGI